MHQLYTLCLLMSVWIVARSVSAADEGDTSSSCPSWSDSGTLYPAIGRRTITLEDPSRNNRTLTVDIWYPAVDNGEELTRYSPFLPSEGMYVGLDNPSVATPIDRTDGFPLLVFSHGSGGIRQQSPTLMEHMSSWGYVIASPDHAGNSMNDPPGSDIPFSIRDRPRDLSFVIDSMLSSPYVDEFHLRKAAEKGIGVLGHSYGGLTSLLIGAAPDGLLADERVKAIMPISPASLRPWVGQNFVFDTSAYLSNVNVQTFVIGGLNDTSTPPDPNQLDIFEQTNGLPRWNIVLKSAGHSSFTDVCVIFETLLSVVGNEDSAYALLGGGEEEVGRQRISQSYCESIYEVQRTTGYYAVAFFNVMLLLGDNDKEGSSNVVKCMDEQSDSFPLLHTYDFLGNTDKGQPTANVASTQAPSHSPTIVPEEIMPDVEDGAGAKKDQESGGASSGYKGKLAIPFFAMYVILMV